VAGSVSTKVGAAIANGSKLVVPVTVLAGQVPSVDVGQLRAGIMGKSLEDARSFLSQYGKVDISISPDWVSTVPNFDFRIDIRIVDVSSQPSSGPTATRIPSGTGPRASLGTTTPSAVPSGSPTPVVTDTPLITPAPTDTPPPTDTAPPATPTPGPSAT
jgi:hypothetical protein